MANITLSIPEELYRLMKKYRSVNWSEVARRAIVKEILHMKARDEGLTLRELDLLLEVSGVTVTGEEPTTDEAELQKRMRERERRRITSLGFEEGAS